jgi:hypothetical protein
MRPTPENRPIACPQVTVNAQATQRIRDGQPVVFTANIIGGDPRAVPTILWSTSGGFISRGQNTRSIVVDTTGAGTAPDTELRAEVWISGYAPECVLQAAASVKVIPPAAKFGDFGMVSDETLKTNLKKLADYMSQSPDNLYVIVYSGRSSERGFASTWARKIRTELTAAGLQNNRVMAIDGGYREEPLFDFWTVPIGAVPPRPEPTIDRREILMPRSAPAKKP